MKLYWFTVIVIISAFAINFRLENESNKRELSLKSIELKRQEIARNKYSEHKEYIMLHCEELAFIKLDEFTTSLKAIAKLSGIKKLDINDIQESGHTREFSLQLKAKERSCYTFIYYCERIINGVFDIKSLKLVKAENDLITMKMRVKVTYFDLKFKHNRPITGDINKYAKAIQKDMNKRCNIQLFKTKPVFKLNGIIGDTSIINNRLYKVGDTIGGYTLQKINDLSVIVQSPNNETKNVDLGKTFQ